MSTPVNLVTVHNTELLASDTREQYRQKIARITLDSMVQFVGLLDAKGTVLEINQVALNAVGILLSDVEGKPFWTTFWWQVSEEINATLRESILRASKGEFVRWDTEIYGRAGGKETIIIDASLMPVKDEQGNVVFIAAEGRDITAKKAYEREIARQREELAQLDKLKTQFFANISHEFRTPLTLMMGPLEDMIAQPDGLSAGVRERLGLAHRNSLRLLKLVNTLLDFSRIEAGRIQASYEPTDLALLTAELAGVFRSAIEQAGMQLQIHCPALPEMVYVDREMWEKIVLNLLSNAFKFTFEGEISISLRFADSGVEMTVRDTGTGIPTDEIPRLFERFHRVKGARGRSYEGSGIGLALVQELVRLHGGTIAVESVLGKGTEFRVHLLLGKAHLPVDQLGASRALASTAVRANAFVEEALRWHTGEPLTLSPEASNAHSPHLSPAVKAASLNGGKHTARVLVVDDNADMRDYLTRLLGEEYTVLTAANGEQGVRFAHADQPDLVLTDIMMPGLDGFGLLRALRSDTKTQKIPVIFLSARAGEEASIEGHDAGADDYLVKPFSARELLARVSAHLKLARAREEGEARIRDSEARFRALVNAGSDVVYRMSADWTEMRQLDGRGFLGDIDAPNKNWIEQYIHPDEQPRLLEAIHYAIATKSSFELEHRVRRADGTPGWALSRAVPILDDRGEIIEWFGSAGDVTARKLAEDALRQSEERFRAIVETTPECVKLVAADGTLLHMNTAGLMIIGARSLEGVKGKCVYDLVAPEDRERFREFNEGICGGRRGSLEFDVIGLTGIRRHMETYAAPLQQPDGSVVQLAVARDVTLRKQAEEAQRRLAAIVESSDDAIASKDLNGIVTSWNRGAERLFGYTAEEIIGQSITLIIPPELRKDEAMILAKIRHGERIEHFETVRMTRDGERIEVSLVISPVKNEQGKVVGAAKIVRNITESKKIERALRTTEKLAAAGRLAATAAHEINNPLEAVTNLVYLAKRDLGDLKLSAAYLELASRELDRVAHIARQTLGFYRDTSSPSSVNIAQALDDLLLLYETRLQTRNITVRKEFDETVEITALGGEIRQAFSNLITNSIDAMPTGGSLRIRVSRAHEWNHPELPGVRITIADQGVGIASQDKANLFQPFFTTKTDIGTGLGLWITRTIVEKHGGTIRVRSKAGVIEHEHGTVFSIFLPRDTKNIGSEISVSAASFRDAVTSNGDSTL